MTAENAGEMQRGRPFRKGQSGNPAGKPKGARNRATVAVEALLDGEAEALTRKAIELAKTGDMAALRLCLERIVPPRKGRAVVFDLPEIETATDVVIALGALANAVARGELTPEDGAAVAGLLEAKRRALETIELEKRIAVLEAKETKQ